MSGKGIPQALATRIERLKLLFANLPSSLPLLPRESAYAFGLDNDDIKQEGMAFAFNRNLEVVFRTFENPVITLNQRGPCYVDAIALFGRAARSLGPGSERDSKDGVMHRWLDRLISAAERAGAKVPKKRKADEISDNETQASPAPALARRPIIKISSDSESNESGRRVPEGTSPVLKQASLFNFGCKKITPAEARAQRENITKQLGTDPAAIRAKEEQRKKERVDRKKEHGRERQRRFRAKQKEDRARQEMGEGRDRRAQKRRRVLANNAGQEMPVLEDLAEMSRMNSSKWRESRNGTKNGVIKEKSKRINYFIPFLWAAIDRAAPKVAWSPAMIVKTLQLQNPALYGQLNRGTVFKWISAKGGQWSKRTLKKVDKKGDLTGSGRVGVLTPYPELVEEIKTKLVSLRKTGVPLDRVLVRSIILAFVSEREPHLLASFKCSEHYVSQFLASKMGFSLRKGTRTAAKLPDDYIAQCERALFRVVHLLNLYDVPPSLIINMDQTGVLIMMSRGKTYEKSGSRQVDIAHLDEKRAYTLCVATTPAGDILPFQQVWSGRTENSLPSSQAPKYAEAVAERFHFTVAASQKKTSHFSTLKTMKEWMASILLPYVQQYIADHDLPQNQKAILLIDCYPVHVGKEFRTYVFEEYPNVFLLFIPAGCTGVFQAADVGLNRVIKHFLRQEAIQYLVDSHTKQIASGLTTDQIKFTTSLPALRDASVQPLVKLFNYLCGPDGRDLIKNAWDKCSVKEWNLGEGCLTSKKTKAAYREYLETDTTLRREIENKIGREALLEAVLAADDAAGGDYDVDSSDIPLSTVASTAAGTGSGANVASIDDNRFVVTTAAVEQDQDGVFVPTSHTENIWAYTVDGVTWAESLAES